MIVNTPNLIRAAMSSPGRPITTEEFIEFWNSLSVDEKEFWMSVTPEELGL